MPLRRKHRFIAAIAILAALCVVLLAAVGIFYTAEHQDHHCAGEDCQVCLQLYNALQSLRQAAGLCAGPALAGLALGGPARLGRALARVFCAASPVSRKVKLTI